MSKEKSDRDFIRVAVETALLELGTPELEKVVSKLQEDYNCEITDCLEHPEFLKSTLYDLFSNSYEDILATIRKTLEKGNLGAKTEKFLLVLESSN